MSHIAAVLARAKGPGKARSRPASPSGSGGWPRRRLGPTGKAGVAAVALFAAGLVANWLAPPDLTRFTDRSVMVLDREGGLLRGFTARDGAWRLAATPGDVDPLYLKMLLAYEDKRFRRHPGVDPLALGRALTQAIQHGRVVSGASTLTMQAARLLEPRSRTLGAKLVEMLRAGQLEWRRSKDEVLSIYLTLAPYGGNLEGVRAATHAYFGKSPKRLTPGEAALLVALPQSPTRLRPDRHPAAARAARDKVLDRMLAAGVLTATEAMEARQEPVPAARRAMPFRAPHLARRLALSANGRTEFSTTIDPRLQLALERLLATEGRTLDPRANVAVLVVENRTRAVRAYVGSTDFFDARRFGQIDMVNAVRSPGSALKPFIYGLAFDDRLVHPETLINDAPQRFGDYQPENFMRAYHGEVSIREALQQSLNVPAVAVLEKIGPARFTAHLEAAGMTMQFGNFRGRPGLPVALGGVGVTLEDLTMLYTALAKGGEARALHMTRDSLNAPKAVGMALMSPAAAWQIARILENAPRPSGAAETRHTAGARRIAFKTGTSYGFRDAWAAGFDRTYTVGVWVGRPDGTPSPGRFGRLTAAPILFKAFGLLPAPRGGVSTPKPPKGVVLARNEDLPAGLRYFGQGPVRVLAANAPGVFRGKGKPLSIVYPPNGALVALEPRESGYQSLPLQAEGGVRPLTWLVNGRPIGRSSRSAGVSWRPDGPGYVAVTVVDAEGRSHSVEARLR